jgi:hypothetical protein
VPHDPGFRNLWWREARASPDVVGARLQVLLVMSTWTVADGTGAHPSIADIAAATGMGLSTVRRHLAWARQNGWLRVERRGHRRGDGQTMANEYSLSLPLTQASAREAVSTAHPGERKSDPQPLTQPVSTAHPGEHPRTLSLDPVLTPLVPPSRCRRCDNGWLGEDEFGRVIRCPDCKPAARRRTVS